MSGAVGAPDAGREVARLPRDVLRYLPASVVPALCAVAGAALFTRVFSPTAYGLFSLVVSVTGPISTVLGQPTGQAASRFYSEYRARGQELLYRGVMTALAAATASGALVLSALGLAVWAFSGGAPASRLALVGAAGLLVLGSAVSTTLLPVLAARFRPRPYAAAVMAAAVLSVAVSGALVLWAGPHVVYLVLGPAVAALVVLPLVVRYAGLVSPRQLRLMMQGPAPRQVLARFVRYGVPLASWFLAMSLLNSGDRYILAWFAGTRAVGVYSVNYNLASQSVGLLNMPMVTAAWPVIARQWAGERRAAMAQSLTAVSTFYLTLSLGVAAVVWAASHPLVTLLLGPAFRGGAVVFGPILAAMILWGLARVGQKSLELHERTGWMVKDAAVAAGLSLLLTALLVPHWSYLGAAWATVAGYAVYTALIWRDARRCVPWTLEAPLWLSTVAIAGAAAMVVLLGLPQPSAAVWAVPLDASVAAVLYVAGLAGREWLRFRGRRDPPSEIWKKKFAGLFQIKGM